jgi:hypothetical protein
MKGDKMKVNKSRASAATPKAHNIKDTVIIPEKERNYIDTLYLSCNIQDFGDTVKNHSTYNYYLMKEYLEKHYLEGSEYLGSSAGREWYKTDNFTLGLMEHDTAKKANQPNCIIQYDHSHIFPLDQNLTGIELPFTDDRSKYMIKRIDITKTLRIDTDYTVNHGYISPFKTDPLNHTRYENTVYLGSRKNGNVFRMYPKTKELMETKNYDKIALYSQYFGSIENLYTFEHELHRSYLKETLGIDTLAELGRVWEASQNIVSKIRIFEYNDKNKKLLRQNNRQRIKAMVLNDYVEYDRPEKKKYKRSYSAMIRRIKSEIDAYLDSGETEDNLSFWVGLIYDLTYDVTKDGKELQIWVNDSDRAVDMGKMRAKWQLLRDNQTNELEKEATRLFGDFLSSERS